MSPTGFALLMMLDAFSQLYGEADVDAALGILQDLDEVHYCLWEMNWLRR